MNDFNPHSGEYILFRKNVEKEKSGALSDLPLSILLRAEGRGGNHFSPGLPGKRGRRPNRCGTSGTRLSVYSLSGLFMIRGAGRPGQRHRRGDGLQRPWRAIPVPSAPRMRQILFRPGDRRSSRDKALILTDHYEADYYHRNIVPVAGGCCDRPTWPRNC